jgi:hypothetical protein
MLVLPPILNDLGQVVGIAKIENAVASAAFPHPNIRINRVLWYSSSKPEADPGMPTGAGMVEQQSGEQSYVRLEGTVSASTDTAFTAATSLLRRLFTMRSAFLHLDVTSDWDYGGAVGGLGHVEIAVNIDTATTRRIIATPIVGPEIKEDAGGLAVLWEVTLRVDTVMPSGGLTQATIPYSPSTVDVSNAGTAMRQFALVGNLSQVPVLCDGAHPLVEISDSSAPGAACFITQADTPSRITFWSPRTTDYVWALAPAGAAYDSTRQGLFAKLLAYPTSLLGFLIPGRTHRLTINNNPISSYPTNRSFTSGTTPWTAVGASLATASFGSATNGSALQITVGTTVPAIITASGSAAVTPGNYYAFVAYYWGPGGLLPEIVWNLSGGGTQVERGGVTASLISGQSYDVIGVVGQAPTSATSCTVRFVAPRPSATHYITKPRLGTWADAQRALGSAMCFRDAKLDTDVSTIKIITGPWFY